MIGFYLNTKIEPFTGINIRIAKFEQFSGLKNLEKNCLYLFVDDNQGQILQSGDTYLYSVGAVIYRKKWGIRALNFILQDLKKGAGIQNIVETLKGQYCLVIANKSNVCIITDRFASFPVFRFNSSDCIQISNILPCLLKHNKVSFNPQGISEYISLGFCFNGTFLNEIEWLKMAMIYKFGDQISEIKYYEPLANISFGKYRNAEKVAEMVSEVILENLSFLDERDKIYADITGGFDTRTVAALLGRKGYKFTGGMCPDPIIHFSYKVSDEVKIAGEVCAAMGIDYRDNFNIEDYNAFLEVLKTQLAITAGVPIPFCNADYINYFQQIKKDFSIHIAGYVGSQVFKQEMKKLNLVSSKFNIKSQLGKRYRYQDIFDSDFIIQKEFETSITEKFRGWLKDLGTDNFKHAAACMSILGYSKGWHGLLMNTHTCLIPVYAPFYDIDCARILMETDYDIKKQHLIQKYIISRANPVLGTIMTTHGYNADPGSSSFIKNLKGNTKDLIRPLIYYSSSLTRLRRRLEKYLYPATNLDERKETYWEKYINENFSNEMRIYLFIDKSRIEKNIFSLPKKRRQTILARILFVNYLMEKYDIS
jgi:hypothetical protein